ncbi:amino-acid oxidase [Fusarium beomiforme]|uniref:Amino-acid oxidase n=1 Tax=Fusarium beomiforme TaxID=44412 RepID=A0A9P5AB20_9HYPO|nr:amino-acid oxidase [Fusarium beomiforme]
MFLSDVARPRNFIVSDVAEIRNEEQTEEDSILMNDENGIDTLGPWFDGVEHLSKTGLSALDADAAKEKEIAIVGAGMSGLMTYLVLSQAGMTNISIIEAGNRLGGRVHTEYLTGGPFDYSYQEMGPMRFPSTYKSPETNETMNITDHQLVFQLAEEMNKLNGHDKNFSVDFIPWLQSSPNGLSYKNEFKLPSGLPPTLNEIANNASLGVTSVIDPVTKDLQSKVDTFMPGSEFSTLMAKNMFKAHKQWLETGLNGLGGDQWSEYAFMVNYLKGSLNSTDMNGGWSASSFWDSLYEGMYFSAASYKTIDGGLNRLPLSFHPHVDNITSMGRKVERIRYSEADEKVTLQWRKEYNDTTFQNSTYDYAIIAVPFSVVRRWRLPSLPATIANAIKELNYGTACKVALEFSERFWEHYENPIYGGCSTTTDIPGIGSICYPSYNLNGTGPATILASYISGDMGVRLASMSEEDHVQMVLDSMIEIHGEFTRKLYTGKYNRRCWALDPLESGSWASPTAGQHQLYIPEYFKTYNNMIFVGEHTSYTHAWIASALDSGIRGAVQLLLELGLVDEAKQAVEKWMARWIEVSQSDRQEERKTVFNNGIQHLTFTMGRMVYIKGKVNSKAEHRPDAVYLGNMRPVLDDPVPGLTNACRAIPEMEYASMASAITPTNYPMAQVTVLRSILFWVGVLYTSRLREHEVLTLQLRVPVVQSYHVAVEQVIEAIRINKITSIGTSLSYWFMRGLYSFTLWLALFQLSWMGSVTTHNAIHLPIFWDRSWNNFYQICLSLQYGGAVSVFIPGHNLSHHKYTQQARDVMRTTKVRYSWNLLNGLLFFWHVVLSGNKDDKLYFEAQARLNRPIVKQRFREEVAVWGATAVLILLDWRRWIWFALLPQFYAKYCILSINFLQHDGCDMSSKYNFARNFTGKTLNYLCFNNGYHTVHHLYPGLHWSVLPQKHQELISPHIASSLESSNILLYMWKSFIYPGIRLDYTGRPLVVTKEEHEMPDEPWFYQDAETFSNTKEYLAQGME